MTLEKYKKFYPAAGAVVLLLLLWLSFFSVRETEFVLVTQFGRPVDTVTEAGLHFKWPFQNARYFDRRLRIYNPRPSEFLTRDKKNLVIESYVAWQIADPQRFVETVGDPIAAEMRLHDIIWSSLSASMGNHDLEEIITPAAENVKAGDLLDNVTELTDNAALERYGIRVVDVRIKRLNLPEQNKQSVYARMRAERERIARLNRRCAPRERPPNPLASTAGPTRAIPASTSCCARSSPTRRSSATIPPPSSARIQSC